MKTVQRTIQSQSVNMRTLCFLLCLTYANCFYDSSTASQKDKIVGGQRSSIESLPFQASLFKATGDTRDNICGASIIDKSWILTAAHCVFGKRKSQLSIRTGSSYRLRNGEFHEIETIIRHPEYDHDDLYNDIALIKLSKPIVYSKVQKRVRIAKPDDIPRKGQLMLISGFGKEGERIRESRYLKSVYVPVSNQTLCHRAYDELKEPLTDSVFCAGDGTTDSCQGDSGGAGIINGTLYGIVSYGQDCGSKTFPGIYTRVHKYYDWIVESTGLRGKL